MSKIETANPCALCGGELSEDAVAEHLCCPCLDSGFRRRKLEETDRDFGKATPCECRMTGIPEQEFVRRSKIPETMRDYSLDSWPGSAKPLAMALEFVESWPPKKPLIFLTGTVGGGKTGLSVGIAREVWKRHHMVARFMTAPGLLRRFHATFGEDATESTEEVHREMDSAALVILDDYGTEKSTDFAAQEMFRLINTRYEQGKPLIVTTNLDMLSLDARITSRLRDTSRAYWLEFKGADRRLA